MNEPLTTESLAAAAAESLSWLSELGFKYFKSYRHFRKKTQTGFSYVSLNTVTHNRQNHQLAFYLATRVDKVEGKIKELHSRNLKLNHYDRTIWLYTVNVGPDSPHWTYPIGGTWSIGRLADFSSIEPEITSFIRDLGLPYVSDHIDPLKVHETLIRAPGHATNLYPYEQILAADLLFQPDHIDSDIALLRDRYRKFADQPKARFEAFISLIEREMEGADKAIAGDFLKAAPHAPTLEIEMGSSKIYTPKPKLIDDLLQYGELDVARAVARLSEEELEPVYVRAVDYTVRADTPSGKPMLIAKALAMAAVEVIEGTARELKRTRRSSRIAAELARRLQETG